MSNVPKLRFNDYDGIWKSLSIQELIASKAINGHLDGNHGALYPRSEEFTSEGVPYVSANDFADGTLNLNRCKCLPPERALKFKKGVARDGDVLFAHNATVGPVTILNTDLDYVILSTTATYFRCSPNKLSNRFLKAYFSTYGFIKQYSRVMSQSTRNQVPITAQRQFEVSLPSLPEQQKIADFLTAVDTKIEQLTRKEELLKQYKKGVMQKIFSQEIRFKADDGSEFPEWEATKLGSVGVFKSGVGFPDAEQGGREGVPFYKVSDMNLIGNETEMLSANNYVNKEQVVRLKLKPITAPAIIFAKVGAAIFLERKRKAQNFLIDNNVMAFIPEADIEFMHQLLMQIRISKFAQTGALPSYNGSDLATIKINLPKRAEQQKISSFLTSIDRKIEQGNLQTGSAKTFKKGLLQQMFV